MLSRTAEYGILAIVFLGKKRDVPQTTSQLAEAIHVPAPYLTKVLRSLAKAGLVSPRRGPNGGFTLGPRARGASVLEIVAAVDPPRRTHGCPLGEANMCSSCPLDRWFCRLRESIDGLLQETSITDLVKTVEREKLPATAL